MSSDLRHLAALNARVPALGEVDRNGVLVALEVQVVAHRDRTDTVRVADKLIRVNPFQEPLGGYTDGIFFRGFDSRLWYQLRDGCD